MQLFSVEEAAECWSAQFEMQVATAMTLPRWRRGRQGGDCGAIPWRCRRMSFAGELTWRRYRGDAVRVRIGAVPPWFRARNLKTCQIIGGSYGKC